MVAHIASDNVQGGYQAGKLMCRRSVRAAAVAIIDEPEVTSVQDRVKGFRQGSRRSARASRSSPTSIRGGNARQGEQRYRRHPAGAQGSQRHLRHQRRLRARRADRGEGRRPDRQGAIVGYDATPEARTAIAAGEMYGDAIQYPDRIGATTIDVIHDYFAGKKPPYLVKIGVGTFTQADAKAQ